MKEKVKEQKIMDDAELFEYLIDLKSRNEKLYQQALQQLSTVAMDENSLDSHSNEEKNKLYTMGNAALELSEEKRKKIEDALMFCFPDKPLEQKHLILSYLTKSIFLHSPYYDEDLKVILGANDIYQAYMISLAATAEKSIQSPWHRQIIQLLATAKDCEEAEEIERFFMAHNYFIDLVQEDPSLLTMELEALIDVGDVSFENVKQKVIPYMMYNGKKK